MTGRLILSMAGHDKGQYYLVIKEEKDILLLSDGRTRGILKPKKKNRKHVQPCEQLFTAADVEAFLKNPAWADNMIREKVDQINKKNRKEA